jgi:peptidoglycan/LPS O-acetylase OafA/YrhL
MTPADTRPARYLTLDHWRGFAALWVLGFHGFSYWNLHNRDALPRWLGDFFGHGWLGVHVFFVISGYCITERLARDYRQGGPLGAFLSDRLLRIFPPYWVALAGALALNLAGQWSHAGAPANPEAFPSGWQWLTAGTATAHWLGHPTFLLVAWSLSYEIAFYFLAALGFWLVSLGRRPWLGFAWGLLLAGVGLTPFARDWMPVLVLWPHFLAGGLAWLLLHHAKRQVAGATLLFGLAGAIEWAVTAGGPRLDGLTAFGTAWLLVVLHPWDQALGRFAGLGWLGWVGTFSYSLYLVHAPLIGRTYHLFDRWPAPLGIGSILLQVVFCAITVGLAWAFYQLVERRTEEFRKSRRRQAVPAGDRS